MDAAGYDGAIHEHEMKNTVGLFWKRDTFELSAGHPFYCDFNRPWAVSGRRGGGRKESRKGAVLALLRQRGAALPARSEGWMPARHCGHVAGSLSACVIARYPMSHVTVTRCPACTLPLGTTVACGGARYGGHMIGTHVMPVARRPHAAFSSTDSAQPLAIAMPRTKTEAKKKRQSCDTKDQRITA